MLVLTKKGKNVQIFFRDGNIHSAETQNRDHQERLGQMMMHAGLITMEQLGDGLEQQKKTLQKIGSILVEKQYIKKSELDEFIYLQTKETIFRLFRWSSGTYQFHQQDVPEKSEFFQPISAEHILMDGFRIIDEWPSIRKKVGSYDTIYEINPTKSLTAIKGAQVNLDSEVDAAFSEFDGKSSPENVESLSPNAARMLDLVDGQRDLTLLIASSRIGEFDSCQALAQLIDLHYIQQSTKIRELPDEIENFSIDLYQDYGVSKKNWMGTLSNVIYYGSFFFVLFLVLVEIDMVPFDGRISASRQKITRPIMKELVSEYQLQRIRGNLEVHNLENGIYPKSLEELSLNGLLTDKDLRYPWTKFYEYISDGSGFQLNKPFL